MVPPSRRITATPVESTTVMATETPATPPSTATPATPPSAMTTPRDPVAVIAGDAIGTAGAVPPAPAPRTLPVASSDTRTLDVGALSTDELQALRRSRDPMLRARAITAIHAKSIYADRIAGGARVLVTASAGNRGYPVLVLIPEHFDPQKPARAHTHYHGNSATVAVPVGHGSGRTLRMKEIAEAKPQTIFVLPEMMDAPTDWATVREGFAGSWLAAIDPRQATEDALAAAGIVDVGFRTCSFFSSGSQAFQAAIGHDRKGRNLAFDRIEVLDCMKNVEDLVANFAQTETGRALKSFVYARTAEAPEIGKKVARRFGDRFALLDVHTFPRDDDSINPVVYRPYPGGPFFEVRRKWGNAHNRACGQFMDFLPDP